MKRRIMERSRILHILSSHPALLDGERSPFTEREYAQAGVDLACYVLADGDTVKIYNDRNMGGTVVEIKD